VVVPILLAGAIGLSDRELIHLNQRRPVHLRIASIIQSVGFWKIRRAAATAAGRHVHGGVADDRHRAGRRWGHLGLLVIYGSVIVAGLATFLVAPSSAG